MSKKKEYTLKVSQYERGFVVDEVLSVGCNKVEGDSVKEFFQRFFINGSVESYVCSFEENEKRLNELIEFLSQKENNEQ